jgi:predicted metal-dependent hydrolase
LALKALLKYKELIIKGDYFEAHEVLEKEWHKIRKTDNDLKWALKGLINAAVAMELKKRNRKNYNRVWKNFEKYEKFYNLNPKIRETSEFVKKYKP